MIIVINSTAVLMPPPIAAAVLGKPLSAYRFWIQKMYDHLVDNYDYL